MTSEDDFIRLPKDSCVLNTLAMGVAIQIIAKLTGEEIEEWKEHVQAIASKQYRELSAEKMQEIVESLNKTA
jgi:redox-regulated HSP33 family molecular chaperone